MWRRIAAFALSVVLGTAVLAGVQHLRLSVGPDLTRTPDGALRIATWNVHYIMANRQKGRWGLQGWEHRKAALDATFKSLNADVVAFQEMETFAGGNADTNNLARRWLLENNPSYAAASIGDWREFPSTQPIFYRTDRLELLDQGWFFFSETPDEIYSRTFNGSYPAFASWARFREIGSGRELRVLNVHLDYSSAQNRRRSAELIADRAAPWIEAGETLFLAADLNAWLGSALHRRLEAEGLAFVPVRGATYHMDAGIHFLAAIDHIAFAGAVAPSGPPMVQRQNFGAVWPSDHYPVVADFVLSAP